MTPELQSIAKQCGFSDCQTINNVEKNLLLTLMEENASNLTKLKELDITHLLLNSNLNHVDRHEQNALMIEVLGKNSLVFSENQVLYMIKNTNLETVDSDMKTVLNYAILNKSFISPENLDYILKNSDIKNKYTTHIPELSFFEYALIFQAKNSLLTYEQLDYLYENSPHKNKELNYHNPYYANKILKAQVSFLEEKLVREDKDMLKKEILPVKIERFRQTLIEKKQFKV